MTPPPSTQDSSPAAARPAAGRKARYLSPELLLAALALLSLILAWHAMAAIGPTDPWYRNLDMNIHNTADALAINTGLSPNLVDQPGVPMKLLLALDFRLRHYLGWLPVWNLKKFGASTDPLAEIPPLIRIGRVHSRILVMFFLAAAAWLVATVTRNRKAVSVALILLCGNDALLFHGLFTRPELLCVGFGNVLALGCTWRGVAANHWPKKYGWLFLAGLLGGLSTQAKLPGVCYLALCYGWCWLGALTAGAAGPASPPAAGFWRGLLPAAGGVASLWLLFQLTKFHEALGPVAILRLRVLAVICGILPLVSLWEGGNRLRRFLLARVEELAVLGGGALTSLSLIYLAMRSVMAEPQASDYITRMLHFMFDLSTTLKIMLDSPRVGPVLVQYFQQNPLLFFGALGLALGFFLLRSVSMRLKAFAGLLLAGAVGMTLVMSRRHFALHYSIFPQVPLLLACAISLEALTNRLCARLSATAGTRWALPVAAGVAFVLVLTIFPRLQYKYERYQSDDTLPVNALSLTFLFDHDAHTATYLSIMRQHYHDRKNFARTLDRYLADPAHRY